MNAFKASRITKVNAIYTFYQKRPGEINIPVHKTGKTYIALTNDFNYKNFVEIAYRTDIVNGAEFDLSIENTEKDNDISVNIYPNPAENQLTIESANYIINDIKIIDVSGKVIKHIQNKSQLPQYHIDVNDIKKGIYFISLYSIRKNSEKFIKNKSRIYCF